MEPPSERRKRSPAPIVADDTPNRLDVASASRARRTGSSGFPGLSPAGRTGNSRAQIPAGQTGADS